MKFVGLALVLCLLVVAFLFFSQTRLAPAKPIEPLVAGFEPAPARLEPPSLPLPPPLPSDDAGKLYERLGQVLAKLDTLEVSVREAKTEITLRTDERSRAPATVFPSNATSPWLATCRKIRAASSSSR